MLKILIKPLDKNILLISISKKNFRHAVDRNKIKRRIREIFRSSSYCDLFDGMVVFSVFKPFGELSYSNTALEIESAVELFINRKKKK